MVWVSFFFIFHVLNILLCKIGCIYLFYLYILRSRSPTANFYSPSQLIISISNLQWQIVTWNTQQNWHSKSDDCCSDICSLNQHKYLEGKSSSPNQHKYLEGKLCSPFSLTKLQGKLCNTSILILTLFPYSGYHFDTSLPFSLYLLHGFHSESEQTWGNRVNRLMENFIEYF